MGLALVIVFLAGVLLVVLYQAGRADFVARFHDGRLTCKGRLAQQVALEQFLRDDLAVRGPVRITGRRLRGRLLLWFGGELTPGQQQRIRNFLLVHR
jgi:hypothetical protein